jgi:hypothetical protein
MTTQSHETAAHKQERTDASLLESAAKYGASDGSGYGARRVLAQSITAAYGEGWAALRATGIEGNEVARFAQIECVKSAYKEGFVAAAMKKGVTEKIAKRNAIRGWQSVQEHGLNIDAEAKAREEALALQARIEAGEDVVAIEAEAAAERGTKARTDVLAGILKSASADYTAGLTMRYERDAMELDADKVLDNVVALLADVVHELGGDDAVVACGEAAKKKANKKAPIA